MTISPAPRSTRSHRTDVTLWRSIAADLGFWTPVGVVIEALRVRSVARRLAEIRAATNLKLPDCCVIHAAEEHNAAVATFDAGLADARFKLSIA